MAVFNKVTGFVGGAGTGKTTTLRNMMNVYLKKGMKVLIVDDFDHPTYRDVPKITIEQLPRWKGGIYRLIHSEVNEKVFPAINENVWNALVVFEDCFKYVGNRFTKPMLKLVIDAKQKNVDFVFMYHCWAWVALDLARRADAYVMFKANDTPESRFTSKDAPYLPKMLSEFQAVLKDESQFKTKLFKTGINAQTWTNQNS